MSHYHNPPPFSASSPSPSPVGAPIGIAAVAAIDEVFTEKGRIVGKQFLSARDEEILLAERIEINRYLGAGFFGNVWRGIYTAGNIRREYLHTYYNQYVNIRLLSVDLLIIIIIYRILFRS